MSELLLRGGTVVDGSGGERRRADVLCGQGRIMAVGENLSHSSGSGETIDCGDLIVAPGFIDTHSHSDLKIFEDPALPMKVQQGVTLEVLGQDGISVAPVRKEAVAETRRQLMGLLGDPQAAPWNWERSEEYVAALRKVKPAQDVRYLVPHGTLRAYVMGPEARRPTDDELTRMCRVLDDELGGGAIGMSTGLIYPPCCYAERDELVALAQVVARHGGPIVVHMRSESDYILDAVREMIDIGKTADCAIHISHWKIAGRENFGLASEMIGLVEEAQAAGVRMTCDQYPYAAGSTVFSAILPPWVHDGGPQAALARLRDPQARARMKADMTTPPPQKWDNFWRWTGPEGITLSDVKTRRELIGKTVAQAAAGKDPLEFALDLLRDENLGVGMVTHSQADAVVDQLMLRPYVNVCTDGLLGGRPHPRAFGSYPRILARHVRERGLLTLEEAVRKMTAQAADAMNLEQKGRIEPGKDADLVVFDAARIEDRATFAEPTQLSVGVEKVIVGGKVVA